MLPTVRKLCTVKVAIRARSHDGNFHPELFEENLSSIRSGSIMRAEEIYDRYNIFPNLREHMYRVAAIGAFLCERLPEADSRNIASACLLHDMGNIIKFNFDRPPESIRIENVEYWRSVRDEAIKKYGPDQHIATIEIAKEIGTSRRTLELINAVGFTFARENAASDDFGKKICAYADMRVAPWGVASLGERLKDLDMRYKDHPKRTEEFFGAQAECVREIERQLCERCGMVPEAISEEAISSRIAPLRDFEIF